MYVCFLCVYIYLYTNTDTYVCLDGIAISTVVQITIHLYTETITSAYMHAYMTHKTRTPSSSSSPQHDGPTCDVDCCPEFQAQNPRYDQKKARSRYECFWNQQKTGIWPTSQHNEQHQYQYIATSALISTHELAG